MDSCPDTDIDPNEGEVSPHIPSGKTSRVYLRISQYQTKVELVFSVYISFATFLWLNHDLLISSSCKESRENLVEK